MSDGRDVRRLRVGYVYRHFRRRGSIATLYVDTAERLARDLEVTAVCAASTREPGGGLVDFLDVEPLTSSGSRLGYAVECWSFARRAAAVTAANRHRFDVVHVEGFASTWGDLVTVHAVRASEVDHYFSKVEPRARIRRHLSPRVLQPQTKAVLAIEEQLLRRGRPLSICPSGAVRDDLVRYHGLAYDDIAVIPYGIDVARFAPNASAARRMRRQLSTPEGRIVLLVVGSEFVRKGVDRAIEALARARIDAELWVLGDDDRVPFRRLARNAGVADRVRFLGARPPRDLPGIYGASDVLLAPSQQDSWAIPVVEAMAAGCVVIASSFTGSHEAIERGVSGFVVEGAGHPAEIAALLDGAVADPRTRANVSARARYAAAAFDSDALAPRRLEMHYRAFERRVAREQGGHLALREGSADEAGLEVVRT